MNRIIRGLKYRACQIVSNDLIMFGFKINDIIVTRTDEYDSYLDSVYNSEGILKEGDEDLGLSSEEVLQLVQDYHDQVAAEKAERDA